MTPKVWYTSLTLWANVGALVVAIAAYFADPAVVSDPRIVTIAASVVSVGNILLRVLRTSQPIEGSPADPTPAPPPH